MQCRPKYERNMINLELLKLNNIKKIQNKNIIKSRVF